MSYRPPNEEEVDALIRFLDAAYQAHVDACPVAGQDEDDMAESCMCAEGCSQAATVLRHYRAGDDAAQSQLL